MKFTIKTLQFLLLSVCISSCVSLSTFQDARTLGKDVTQVSASVSHGKIGNLDSMSLFNVIDNNYYIAEFTGHYGLMENLDVYGEINTSVLHLATGVKYQYIGNKESMFANSIGAEVGYGGFDFFGGNMFHTKLISYNSMHSRNRFSFYINPSYVFYYFGNSGYENDSKFVTLEKYNLFGYNCGFLFGRKNVFGVEISQFANNPILTDNFFITIGYKYTYK